MKSLSLLGHWGHPVLVMVGVLAAFPGGPAMAAPRLVLYLLVEGAIFSALLGRRGIDSLLPDALLVALASGVGFILTLASGQPLALALAAATILLIGWCAPAVAALPWNLSGRRELGNLVFLGVFALSIATPYLVNSPRSGLPERAGRSPYADIPDWVTRWNPIARLHGGVFHDDWFHAPVLYSRVGERLYQYPDATDGLGELGLTIGVVVAVATSIAVVLRRRARAATSL